MLKEKVTAVIFAVMLAVSSINSFVYGNDIQVNIEVDGILQKTLVTEADTVEDILKAGGVSLSKGDVVSPTEDIKLMENSTINVKTLKNVVLFNGEEKYEVATNAVTTSELADSVREEVGENNTVVDPATGEAGKIIDGGEYEVKVAFPVYIYADYFTYIVEVSEGNVASVLEFANILPDENDLVYPALDTNAYAGMEIYITRVAVTCDSENISIPYEVEYRVNKSLAPYTEVVVQEGLNGEMLRDSIVTFHNGNIAGYETKETVTRPAVNKIVECGVYNVKRNDQNAAPAVGTVEGYPYSKVISAKATAYCDKGKTATSISSKVGVVAVDPRVIPLGTRLYIEATDGSWSYGVCLAGDTGGLIKGNRVDLFYDSYDECIQFGRRSCNIYVLAD